MPAHPLRKRTRPDFESVGPALSVVDLFAGCGGLTLGAAQAAHTRGLGLDIRMAVDFEDAPLRVLNENFPTAKTDVASVESKLDGDLGAKLTRIERKTRSAVGEIDLVVGGPPCQGHSDLNNHTRRADPKNRLYLRMARAAEVLQPRVVIVENVPTVVHDSERVVATATKSLQDAGYVVADAVVELVRIGVPQRRRRHILICIQATALPEELEIAALLSHPKSRPHSLRWAIGDLEIGKGTSWVDTPSGASEENRRRMQWLLDNDEYDLPNSLRPPCHQGSHSYVSMYGRLRWDEPAQTITSGFGSIGQGRFMHPSQLRTLTPHEAARIQGFPDYFSFDSAVSRTELAVIIGNAVPPQLTASLVGRLIDARILGSKRDS